MFSAIVLFCVRSLNIHAHNMKIIVEQFLFFVEVSLKIIKPCRGEEKLSAVKVLFLQKNVL